MRLGKSLFFPAGLGFAPSLLHLPLFLCSLGPGISFKTSIFILSIMYQVLLNTYITGKVLDVFCGGIIEIKY